MKNYSSKRAARNKIMYRTPARFIANRSAAKSSRVLRQWGLATRLEPRKMRKDKR